MITSAEVYWRDLRLAADFYWSINPSRWQCIRFFLFLLFFRCFFLSAWNCDLVLYHGRVFGPWPSSGLVIGLLKPHISAGQGGLQRLKRLWRRDGVSRCRGHPSKSTPYCYMDAVADHLIGNGRPLISKTFLDTLDFTSLICSWWQAAKSLSDALLMTTTSDAWPRGLTGVNIWLVELPAVGRSLVAAALAPSRSNIPRESDMVLYHGEPAPYSPSRYQWSPFM